MIKSEWQRKSWLSYDTKLLNVRHINTFILKNIVEMMYNCKEMSMIDELELRLILSYLYVSQILKYSALRCLTRKYAYEEC